MRSLLRRAVPAGVLLLGASILAAPVSADGGPLTLSTTGDPAHAALLNATASLTAVSATGQVGLGPNAIRPGGPPPGVEVAGVAVGAGAVAGAGGQVQTVSTMGDPSLAALLNAGTSLSGIGPDGAVASGVDGFVG